MRFFKTTSTKAASTAESPVTAAWSYLLIHNRVEWYVLALTEHLRRQGRPVLMFGPRAYSSWPAVHRLGDASAVSLTGESAALHQDFLRHYRHLSVNDASYERFCFERWFLVHAFATRHAPFWYIDSDYWLAPSFPAADLPIDKLWDMPYVTPISTAAAVRGFIDYLVDIYRSDHYRTMAAAHPMQGQPHMSDMYALFAYADAHPTRCHAIRRHANSLGVCSNINHTKGYVAGTACRRVLRDPVGETYYCIQQDNNSLVPFHSLHFQGIAKILIPLFIDRDIMAMRFRGSTVADLYRGYLRSHAELFRGPEGQALLAAVRSTPSRSLL